MKKEVYKVSVEKCSDYNNEKVAKVLNKSLKNIGFEFKKGMKILIKPNILSPTIPEKAVTTHPVIIEELCKILKKKNCKIFIGESSAYSTELGFKKSGISKMKKYAEIINFETQEKKFFNFGKGELSKVPLPKLIFEVDLVINIAKMKTHSLTGATLCVKNLYGCIPGRLKENYHRVLPSPKKFSKLLNKIERQIKPQLNILDGVIGLEGLGPGSSGKPIKSKLILASKSAPALDFVATEIMGFRKSGVLTNKFYNLKKSDIEEIGNGKNLRYSFKKANSSMTPLFMWLYFFFPKPKIKFNKDKCKKCHLCEKKCPVDAITLKTDDGYPVCDYSKCIRCLCCVEVCPHDAIYLEEASLTRFAKWIVNLFRKV